MRLFLVIIGLLASPTILYADADVDHRLPAGITPTYQAIELVLDPSKPDYTGTTTIKVTIEDTTDSIALHQLKLALTSITLASGDDSRTLDWDSLRERVTTVFVVLPTALLNSSTVFSSKGVR